MENKFVMYSYKDTKTNQFIDIKLAPNVEVAKRSFRLDMSQCKFSQDIELWTLGEYSLDGIICPCLEFVEAGAVNENV